MKFILCTLLLLVAYAHAIQRIPLGTTEEGKEYCEDRIVIPKEITETEKVLEYREKFPENFLIQLLSSNLSTSEISLEYAYHLLPYSLPGLIMFIIVFLACPVMTIVHCCCGISCTFDTKGPFTKKQQQTALGFYFVFTLVWLILGISGVIVTMQLWEGVAGAVCAVENMTYNFNEFVNGFSSPVVVLEQNALTTVNTVDEILNVTANGVARKLDNLESLLFNLDQSVNDELSNVPPSDLIDPPSSIQETEKLLPEIQKDVQELDAIEKDFNRTEQQVDEVIVLSKETIVDVSGTIKDVIHTANETIVLSVQPVVGSVKDTMSYVEPVGIALTLFVFAFSFIVFMCNTFVFITAITETCTNNFQLFTFESGTVCTYVFMLFVFFLGGILLPLSLAGTDVCGIVVDVPYDLERYLNYLDSTGNQDHKEISDTLRKCFLNPPEPFLSALNLSEAFDFAKAFDGFDGIYTNGTKLNNAVEFQNLHNLQVAVATSELASVLIDTTIEEINLASNTTALSREGCTTTDNCNQDCVIAESCAVPSEFENKRNEVVAALHAERIYQNITEYINGTLINADDIVGDIKERLHNISDGINNIIEEVKPTLSGLKQLYEASECAFMQTDYYTVYVNSCELALASLQKVSIISLFTGFFGVPLLLASVFVAGRVVFYDPLRESDIEGNPDVTKNVIAEAHAIQESVKPLEDRTAASYDLVKDKANVADAITSV